MLGSLAALLLSLSATTVHSYFLMNVGTILQERSDPIVNPGGQAAHVHKIAGGSNFRIETSTSSLLESECTSTKIKEDNSVYWVPQLYFQWENGSFTDVKGDFVIYYLYSDESGKTTPFPEDFRMLSGDPTLRTYDKSSFAQQAVTFLCLDFSGTTSHHDEIPNKVCPSGIRSQINFPSCWNGKDSDSSDHKSHVAFPSGGPDSGKCEDPEYPETVPRIFIEHYWATGDFTDVAGEAKNPTQPFVFSNGDPTGYGYHGDFVNGWKPETLKKVVDECNCNPYGDPQCCADKGIFTLQSNDDMNCHITRTWEEDVKGTLEALPGNNPVVAEGGKASSDSNKGGETCQSAKLDPVYVYKGSKPDKEGEVVKEATCDVGDAPEQPSSTKGAEPSSTKGAEPSSTKNAEPSSTKNTEPSSTKDAEPSSTKNAEPSSTKDAEPSSASASASPTTKVLITDPSSTASPEDDDEEDCDDDSEEPSSTKEESTPSSTSSPDDDDGEDCDDDGGEHYPEPATTTKEGSTPSSTKDASTPSPEVTATPTKVLVNNRTSTSSPTDGGEDDDEDCDDGEYDEGDDEDCDDDEVPEPSSSVDEATPTSAILVPATTTSAPEPSPTEDCNDDEDSSSSIAAPSISSASADDESYTIQTYDAAAPSPTPAGDSPVKAVNNSFSSSPNDDDEKCKEGGRRYSYYSKDGTRSTKRSSSSSPSYHHKRSGHLNRFAAGSF